VIKVSSFQGTEQSRCLLPSPEDGNRSSFLNVFLASKIPDDGQSIKNPVILNIMHHRQNHLGST
jgi:hypothetical protein